MGLYLHLLASAFITSQLSFTVVITILPQSTNEQVGGPFLCISNFFSSIVRYLNSLAFVLGWKQTIFLHLNTTTIKNKVMNDWDLGIQNEHTKLLSRKGNGANQISWPFFRSGSEIRQFKSNFLFSNGTKLEKNFGGHLRNQATNSFLYIFTQGF